MKSKFLRALTASCLPGFFLMSAGGQSDQPAPTAKPDQTYVGTISRVAPQEHTVTVKGSFFSHKQFNVGDSCPCVVLDQSHGTLTDLRPGEKIQVAYQDARSVLVADRIQQLPARYEGVVKAIDPVNHTLTLHLRALDKDFQIAPACQVVLRHDQLGSVADLQIGDQVTVTYEEPGGQATARQIAQTSLAFPGSLVAIDLTDRTVKVRAGLGTKKFNLADNCAIVIDGKTNGRLDDLKPEDRVAFSFDEINGVNVANRISRVDKSTNLVLTTSVAN